MNTFNEHETLNHGCQDLMTKIFILFENSIAASSTSGKTDSCEVKIERISYFPDFIKLYYEMYYIILLKLVNIFEGWIQESITKLLDTSSQLNTVNNEVAISELTTIIITKYVNFIFIYVISLFDVLELTFCCCFTVNLFAIGHI